MNETSSHSSPGDLQQAVERLSKALDKADDLGIERTLFGRSGPGLIIADLRLILDALQHRGDVELADRLEAHADVLKEAWGEEDTDALLREASTALRYRSGVEKEEQGSSVADIATVPQEDCSTDDELRAEVAALKAESAELTKALTGLTCGGSEFFVRKGDRYVADIDACVEWVRRRDRGARKRSIEAIKAKRAAEEAERGLLDALRVAIGLSGPRSDDLSIMREEAEELGLLATMKRYRKVLDLLDPAQPLKYVIAMDGFRKDMDACIAKAEGR